MNTVHTLREYVDALRDAGILVESTVSDEFAAREIHCLTYDTRALSEDALFICKGAHFKAEYLSKARTSRKNTCATRSRAAPSPTWRRKSTTWTRPVFSSATFAIPSSCSVSSFITM